MKIISAAFVSLISLSIFFSSCSKSDVSELAFNVKLEYNGEPLVFFEPVDYGDGREFEFTRFSLYVSDLSLIKDDVAVEVMDVDYWDLTSSHADIASATAGFNYNLDLDEAMSYDAVQFNIGLNSEQNASTPQDHNSSSALSLTGEYWANWNSYVFVKIEGRMDLDNDGISDGIALHLGSDEALRQVELQQLDSPETIGLKIDLAQVFEGFDIDNNPRIHSLNQMPQINLLSDNLVESIVVEN